MKIKEFIQYLERVPDDCTTNISIEDQGYRVIINASICYNAENKTEAEISKYQMKILE
jgi:hypothetical protein